MVRPRRPTLRKQWIRGLPRGAQPIHTPAVAATDNGRLATGNARQHRAREEREGRSAYAPGTGCRSGWRRAPRTRWTSRPPKGVARPRHHRRAARLRPAPFRGGGARRWAPFGRIHAGGDGRRSARECATPVGVATGRFALAISDRASSRDLRVLGGGAWRVVPAARVHHARAKQG